MQNYRSQCVEQNRTLIILIAGIHLRFIFKHESESFSLGKQMVVQTRRSYNLCSNILFFGIFCRHNAVMFVLFQFYTTIRYQNGNDVL